LLTCDSIDRPTPKLKILENIYEPTLSVGQSYEIRMRRLGPVCNDNQQQYRVWIHLD